MKWLIRIVLLLVLLVAIGAIAAVVFVDNIATTTVRQGAAFATQTDVEVQKVDVSLLGASADIVALDIKNPQGTFRDTFDSFLKLGKGSAAVSAGSIMSDKIVVPSVELSDIEISLVGKDGKKNYEVILESLGRFQGDGPPPEETEEGGKQFEITKTTISRITVHYDFDEDPALGAIPAKGTVEIAFDEPMILENLGQGGVPMSQITADLITDIMIQVTANMGEQIGDHILGLTGSLANTVGLDNLTNKLEELDLDLDVGAQLGKLQDLGVDIGEGAGEILEEAGEALDGVGEALDGIGEGLGGILGGDDKENNEEEEGGLLDGINPF